MEWGNPDDNLQDSTLNHDLPVTDVFNSCSNFNLRPFTGMTMRTHIGGRYILEPHKKLPKNTQNNDKNIG